MQIRFFFFKSVALQPCRPNARAILTSCVSDAHSVGRDVSLLLCIAVFVYRVPSFSEAGSCRLCEENKSERQRRGRNRDSSEHDKNPHTQ